MLIVRSPSASKIKLSPITRALAYAWPHKKVSVEGRAVELQAREDLAINAQPFGKDQTIYYTDLRQQEMCRQHGATTGLDISVESGAIDGMDVAVIGLYTPRRDRLIVISRGIPFPPGTLEKAQERGFKTTTAGDIIHEQSPHVPANNWQAHFPPFTSREEQIYQAVVEGLQKLPLP